jgi:CDP-glucose 4,6-dehydratase
VENLEVKQKRAMFGESFRNRKVFVTGHTGFKGSWLAIWLSQLGAHVTGYSLPPPTDPSNFKTSEVQELLTGHYEADIRDTESLQQVITQTRPDFIFHLAAQALVRESYRSPRETWEVNVLGTASLLESVRKAGHPCVVVVVTSDKCYENREQLWGYRECDPMGGFDPYSASKGACELLVSSYRQSFFHPTRLAEHGVKLASARAGNVIGGGDWARDRIVPDLVSSLSQGLPVKVRNPKAIRPWQHVLEPLSGYLLLAARMARSEDPRWCSAWNFGPLPGQEANVAELVQQFCDRWGEGQWLDVSNPAEPHEASVLRLSIDKATWEMGWRPHWDFQEAIRRTADWYHSFYMEPSSASRERCIEDIRAYVATDSSCIATSGNQ